MRQAFACPSDRPSLPIQFLVATLLTIAMLAALPNAAHANAKYAGIVIDAKTGKTLYESSADQPRYPASLTKMMTLYLVFDALKAGRVSLNTAIPVSRNAANEQPSKLGLKPGQTITVENAILALVTKSANDAATAVGEFLGGSEARFAEMMTQRARSLGMSRTTFRNANGLPNSAQKTTARDMARLGLALREHHPRYYKYFSTRSFRYGRNRYGNHNRLLGRVKGVDGIKTGYTRASGFNLVSSVQVNGRSIVAVVMGGRTGASRNAQMQKLIAAYLPKASTRGGGDLIARGGSAPVFASAAGGFKLPKNNPPTPVERPDLRVAYAETVEVERTLPSAAPEPRVAIDPVQTSATAVSGWVIQVASMPSESGARAYLAKAAGSAPSVLASASAFTVTFEKDGILYHRARFGGFGSKSQAWNACAALKKKKMACYATTQ